MKRLADKRYRLFAFGWLLAALFLAACSEPAGDETPSPAPTIASTATPRPQETPPPTATPEPEATATAVPTATPIISAIDASTQTLTDEGALSFSVTAAQAGWLAIYSTADGVTPDRLLQAVMVEEGANDAVAVLIDPLLATGELIAALHIEAEASDSFDPAVDPLASTNGEVVQTTFSIEFAISVPELIVEEQTVSEEGDIVLPNVVALTDGWVGVFTDEGGSPGELLGFRSIRAGSNVSVTIQINTYVATPIIHAVLFEDGGETGRFEPTIDPPVQVQGQPLSASFYVHLPADLFAYDQPVIDGLLLIDYVRVDVPSWLAVYFDNPDGENRIIGFALLEAGINRNVVVEVEPTLVTDELFLRLHDDVGEPGAFDFPGVDQPQLVAGQVPAPFVVRTNPGNYLLTRDQAISDAGTLTVDLIVVDVPVWVIVYRVVDGARDEVIGQQWAAPGLNRQLEISIDEVAVDETILISLHLDAGEAEEFDGLEIDRLLLRNNNPIEAPILILP